MSHEDLDLICTTVICVSVLILVGWMAYLNKR
jgi:hypothetical protein